MFRSAFYEKSITPPLGCQIPGYFRPRIAEDVKENLYAKAVVVDNGENIIAVISIDVVKVSSQMCDKITNRINELTGLKPGNIMICATHTHTGGPIWDSQFFKADTEYVEMLCRLAADCAVLAYKRLSPAVIKYTKGYVDSISFNRNILLKDGRAVTNISSNNPDMVKPCFGIDADLPILFFEDEQKKPIGAILNFACHQDCVGGTHYSGDFSAIMAQELKKAYGEDFVCVFLLGACGNINHADPNGGKRPCNYYIKMGKILAQEALRVIRQAKEMEETKVGSKKEYIIIPKRTISEGQKKEAQDIVENMDDVIIEGNSLVDLAKIQVAERLLEYSKEKETEIEACVQVMKIGDCFLYALPGEVFVQFGLYIKEHSPSAHNMVATLANGYAGYIPTKEMFLPYIYESKLSPSSFLIPEAGDIMSKKAVELAEEF